MPENEQNEPQQNRALNGYAKYTGLAIQMMVIIGGMAFAGYKIDEALGHSLQWVTAVMALFGVFASLYLVIRAVKN
jgi:hypothetical protein